MMLGLSLFPPTPRKPTLPLLMLLGFLVLCLHFSWIFHPLMFGEYKGLGTVSGMWCFKTSSLVTRTTLISIISLP